MLSHTHRALLMSVAFMLVVKSFAAETCVASCEGKAPGSYIEDPHDCHQYYGCLYDGNKTDTPFRCPDGYYYSTSYNDCEYGSCNAKCPLSCTLTCHGSLTLLTYPGDCHRYRVCTPEGGITSTICPSDLPYFDGTECQTDPGLCCDACEIKCYYPGAQIVDPYNCTQFYFCESDGSFISGWCGEGKSFDAATAQCVDGAVCQNACSADQKMATVKHEKKFVPKQYKSYGKMQTLAKNTVPKHSVPQHAVPQHVAPQHAVPQHAVPQHAVPQHAVPQHAVPQHAVPQHAVPQHVEPQQANPQ